MPSSLAAGPFAAWYVSFVVMLGMGTVFFPHALWFAVPVIAGKGCVSGGLCGDMAPALGLWLQPSLLLAALMVGTLGFLRRGRAIGSALWGLFPLALLLPNLPSLFLLGNLVGLDVGSLFLFFPRWSLIDIAPLLALGLLFCLQIEYMRGYGGSLLSTRLYGGIPVGAVYVATCLWVSSDLVLALLPHVGVPVPVLQEIRDVLRYPVSFAGGAIHAGFPAGGVRPDLVVSLGTFVNLAALALLAYALAFDGSGRARRAARMVSIHHLAETREAKPMFRSSRDLRG